MASYLAEVLSSVERVEVEQINTKIPELEAGIKTIKTEVFSHLDDIYVRFTERPKQNKALANKVQLLQSDITSLLNNVDQITRKEITLAEHELAKHLESLAKLNVAISLVARIYKIHQSLIKIKELQQDQSYLICMQEILETEKLISGFISQENLAVVSELNVVLLTEKSSLLNILSNTFKDNIILWQGDNKSVIKIRDEYEQMREVLSALYFYKTSVVVLDNITKFLWDLVFIPIVNYTTEVRIISENNFVIVEIITVDPNKKSSYAEVFFNIKTVLKYLSDNLDIPINEELSTLNYIGRDIRDNLSELIIKCCLQDTIPSTKAGLQQYKSVIEATKHLETALITSKIFDENTTSILEYANNIDVLFINKKCQDYVITAQNFMKKDLHDMVEVGHQASTGLEVTVEFPYCSVSRSVLDLLNFLEKILIEATTSSEVCAGRLFCTIKNISKSYVIFVPEHHKKLLQTIPQQIALFYNNCMYISHKLSEWNDTHVRKLPSILGPRSFSDEGRELVEIASEKFTSFIDSQIKQIGETMKKSDLHMQTLEKLLPSTEKCVRQCLRQQELLRTVWHKVLPYAIYNKALGSILDSLCTHLINVVIKFEDISSEAAEQLVELFKMIQTRGPKLFTDSKEVSLFVSSWYKLNELAFILNASLLDIDDRWADGKGTLALQFKAEELRQLVRALFQNTSRRATLLAKIYD